MVKVLPTYWCRSSVEKRCCRQCAQGKQGENKEDLDLTQGSGLTTGFKVLNISQLVFRVSRQRCVKLARRVKKQGSIRRANFSEYYDGEDWLRQILTHCQSFWFNYPSAAPVRCGVYTGTNQMEMDIQRHTFDGLYF